MSKPIHTYLDLDVLNNNLTSTTVAPQLRFEEIRNTPFLDGDSSEYFCSIVRFSIQTGNSLPIFIPRIETGQSDINKTVYKVTLTWKTNTTVSYDYTASVFHITSDDTATQPHNPTDSQDMSGTYYYHYNVQTIVKMLNTALADAWNGLLALLPWSGEAGPGELPDLFKATYIPYFEFDSDKYRLVLNIDKDFCNGGYWAGRYVGSVYLNTRFYELLSGMPSNRISRIGDSNYEVVPDTSSTKSIKRADGSTSTLYQTFQEISSMAMWNPVASIVFCTGQLPIVSTNTSPPLTYDDTSNNNLTSNGNNSNLSSILSDFEIPVSETNQYRPIIVYNPSSEYRLVDMHSSTSLNKIDITVFWKTHFGDFIPLRLQPGCAAHIKLMFRHKTFYLGY